MRYKILFISSWFPNKLEPTNGNFVQRHAEAVALHHDVEVLHAIGDSAQQKTFVVDDQIINGVRTRIVYYRKSANPLLNFSRRMWAYAEGFSQMTKPDLVHANIMQNSMLFAIYVKKIFKIPFVVSEHWSAFLKINHHRLSWFQLSMAKKIAKNASYLLPVSRYLSEDLKILGFTGNIKVVPNVVDTDLFHLKAAPPQKFTFLHISNLISLKNPEKIIAAAVRLHQENPNFELQIGGDGDVENLSRLIKEVKAESFIKTFPFLTLKKVAVKMRHSDCFILFSDYENFPCVLLESLSTGTPAIATKVGGIPEIIKGRTGILINNSEEELYRAMKNVLERISIFDAPEELRKFVVDRFSMEIIAKKFSDIYSQILA